MSTLEFKIEDLPPMPRNRSHQVVRNMLIKTSLAREFEKDLLNRLEEFEEQFMLFKTQYKEKLHYIEAKFLIYTPKETLLTKHGCVSQKATDFDAHKLFVDVIFKALDMNDKLIRDARIITPISHDEKWNYQVTFTLRNLCDLYQILPLPISNSEELANLL